MPVLATVPASGARVAEQRIGGSRFVREEERHFAELAASAPSAAGFYYDSTGTLVVRVRDQRDERAALARVRAMVARGLDYGPGAGRRVSLIRSERAEYSYRQLSELRDLVFENVFSQHAFLRTLDLDEARNRVTVGLDPLTSSEQRATILQTVDRLGGDTGGVNFKTVSTEGTHFEYSAPTTLRSTTTDAIAGGLGLNYAHGSPVAILECTIGFVAERNGERGIVTASHCSNMPWELDGTFYWHADNQPVGAEVRDVGGYKCGVDWCRGSDANFVKASAGVQLSVGRIARTIGVNSMSTTVDQAHPYLEVVYDAASPVQGQIVDKVGVGTGWTRGGIVGTCEDKKVWTDGKVLRCAYSANYPSGAGDSGGPVFMLLASGDSSEVALLGVHAGKDGGLAYFSKLDRIKSDLGGVWNVIAHPPTAPSSPLSAYVAGPTDVNSSPSCSVRFWTDVTGGSGSYTYDWETDGEIVQDWGGAVWAKFVTAGGHTIQVTVSDGTGAEVTSLLELVSSPSGMDCNS